MLNNILETIADKTTAAPLNEKVRTVGNIYRYTYKDFRHLYPKTFLDMTEDEFFFRKVAVYNPQYDY